jgi:hypothetical protein
MPSPLGIRITPNILVICPDFSYSYMKGFLVLGGSQDNALQSALQPRVITVLTTAIPVLHHILALVMRIPEQRFFEASINGSSSSADPGRVRRYMFC